MKSGFLLLSLAMLSACALHATKAPNTTLWDDFGYEGMAEKINRLAGKDSNNCGIRNYLEESDPVNKQITPSESRACIKKSMKAKQPFRYGSIKIPSDSYLFEAVLLSETGEYWIIKYDYMIDGSSNHHFIDRCKTIDVDYQALSFKGEECQEVTASDWLSDIPVQESK